MKSQARLRLHQPIEPEAAMLIVAGSPFRCSCGANVFTKKSDPMHGYEFLYHCNGCGRTYA